MGLLGNKLCVYSDIKTSNPEMISTNSNIPQNT